MLSWCWPTWGRTEMSDVPIGADVRWTHLPYTLRDLGDGLYILLNRSYLPLGCQENCRVDYKSHETAFKFHRKPTSVQLAKMSYCGKSEDVFFYNDGCVPTHSPRNMAAYLKRLGYLAKLQISA